LRCLALLRRYIGEQSPRGLGYIRLSHQAFAHEKRADA
jgi:hypothetical protein